MNAGEIGYFGINGRKRPPMQLRELGQLEQIIGGAGIEHEWRQRLQKSDAFTSEMCDLKATQVFDLALQGNRTAGDIVRWTAGILADAIADIALLLNPEIVVLGGGVGAHPALCRATEKLVYRHQFAQPLLRSSILGTQAQLQEPSPSPSPPSKTSFLSNLRPISC